MTRLRSGTGPHTSTLLERGLNALPVPYNLACALFALVIGPFGQFTALFLDTHDASVAARETFTVGFSGVQYLTLPAAILADIAFLLLLFFAPYLVRYVRLTIANAERDLAPLQPEGENMYDHVFRWISVRPYPLLLSVPFFLFATYYLYYSIIPQGLNIGIVYPIYVIVASAFSALAFGTFIWVYASSLWGLHNFGKGRLELKPYYTDRMLGLGPVGNISLALTRSYFLGVLLLALTVFVSPDPASLALTITIVMVGIAFFFLPLRTCHKKIVEARARIRGEIAEQLSALINSRKEESATDVARGLSDIRSTMILRMQEEKAESIPSWPLDVSALGNFTVIVLSVSGALISQVIISYLRI